MNLGRN